MHLVKPNWILHVDETRNTKPWLTLYAIDVHPDGSRLATGGLDTVIRIWNSQPVLDKLHEEQGDDKCPRLLSTCTSHTGELYPSSDEDEILVQLLLLFR
jgi:protein HIRA/HIR1